MTAVAIENGAACARRSAAPVVWRRALLAWVIMAVAMSLNGFFRVKVLAPRWGDVWAGVASAASGIALIQLIARQAMQAEVSPSSRQRIRIASLWLLMTIAFEFTFGHYVDSKSWSELLDNYNLLQGHLWPVVLASLVCAPFLWGRPERT
jgi:hypothetical protein